MVSGTEQTNGCSELNRGQEWIQREVNSGDNEWIITLNPLNPLISVDSFFFKKKKCKK